nr:hypothetical protein Iba_chr12cCG18070 [Ipomoea batatas]GMD72940.1 hypothetical protein Iba_chr12fCG13490 [Ipomoea batatas]
MEEILKDVGMKYILCGTLCIVAFLVVAEQLPSVQNEESRSSQLNPIQGVACCSHLSLKWLMHSTCYH